MEIPVEAPVVPEVEAEPIEAPVAEICSPEAPVEAVIDAVADDFVITDSVPVIEAAMAEPEPVLVEEQAPAVNFDALDALSESLSDITPAPAPEPTPIAADQLVHAKEEI